MLKTTTLLLLTIGFLSSCTDAERQKMSALGSEHVILLYSGGVCVQNWTSTGKVISEQQSDGYFFVDKATGKLVRTSGTLVIKQK